MNFRKLCPKSSTVLSLYVETIPDLSEHNEILQTHGKKPMILSSPNYLIKEFLLYDVITSSPIPKIFRRA